MLLSQYRKPDGSIQLVARDGTEAFEVRTDLSLYDLAMDCAAHGHAPARPDRGAWPERGRRSGGALCGRDACCRRCCIPTPRICT